MDNNNSLADDDNSAETIKQLRQQIARLQTQLLMQQDIVDTVQKFSSVVEQTADQVLITNREGIIEYVNPAFETLTGYTLEEVRGKTPGILKSGEHRLQFYQEMWQTISAGEVFRGVLINRKKNGELYYEEKTISPLKNSTGDITHYVSTGKDITEHKTAEVALKASEANYRELADSIADVFFAIDGNQQCIYWNKASERFTGRPSQQAIGQPLAQLLPEALVGPIQKLFQMVLQTRYPHSNETELTLRNQNRCFEITAYPVHNGISVFIKETTRRKNAERTLRQRNMELALLNRASQTFISTLELDQVLSTILEGIQHLLEVTICSTWLVDQDSQTLVCHQVGNDKARSILGRQLKIGYGLVGWAAQHGQSLLIGDVQGDERHFADIEQQLDLTLRSNLCVPLKIKQRVIGVVQVMDSQPDRFDQIDLTLLESLTATAAIAIENARLYKQAQQDAETKAVLLQEVNHRVKNNLAAIIGLLYAKQRQVLLQKINPESQIIYQKVMEDLVGRVRGLATVHSLLSVSEWGPLLLSELASRIIHSALTMAPAPQTIQVAVSPSKITVTSEQAHNLALIINELAINAIKHVASLQESTQITVTITTEDEWVTLVFRDNGPGLPEKVLHTKNEFATVGFNLVTNVVRRNLRGNLSLHNDNGAVIVIQIKQIQAKD